MILVFLGSIVLSTPNGNFLVVSVLQTVNDMYFKFYIVIDITVLIFIITHIYTYIIVFMIIYNTMGMYCSNVKILLLLLQLLLVLSPPPLPLLVTGNYFTGMNLHTISLCICPHTVCPWSPEMAMFLTTGYASGHPLTRCQQVFHTAVFLLLPGP
jgi:hypothetical protein